MFTLVQLWSCDQSVDRRRLRCYLLAAGLLYPGSVSVLTERLSVGVAEEGVLVSVGGKNHTTRISVTDGGVAGVYLEPPPCLRSAVRGSKVTWRGCDGGVQLVQQSLCDGGQRRHKLLPDDSRVVLRKKKTGCDTGSSPFGARQPAHTGPSPPLRRRFQRGHGRQTGSACRCLRSRAYLHLQVCAADGAVQLLLSGLLPVDQVLQLVVPQRDAKATGDVALTRRGEKRDKKKK